MKSQIEGARILVVDDEVDLRFAISSILTKFGAKVDSAADGVDALAKLKVGIFDILLTDLDMPKMNGFKLIDTMKEEGMMAVPVVISAHDTIANYQLAIKHGIFDFMPKPVEVEVILSIMGRAYQHAFLVQFQHDILKEMLQNMGHSELIERFCTGNFKKKKILADKIQVLSKFLQEKQNYLNDKLNGND